MQGFGVEMVVEKPEKYGDCVTLVAGTWHSGEVVVNRPTGGSNVLSH